MEAPGASSSPSKVRKCAADVGAARHEEAKRARVGQHSEMVDAELVEGKRSPEGALERSWLNEWSRGGRAGLPD
jgi:hypothetical protein